MEKFTLIPREDYRKKLRQLVDGRRPVFVVGVRRSGKSCIAAQLEADLHALFPHGEGILRYNLETTDAVRVTADDLIAYVQERTVPGRRNFLLLDEITHIVDWERAIDFFYRSGDYKLFIFSSNRRVVSLQLAAVAEGQFDVVDALPLSLPEFIAFQEFQEITDPSTPLLEKRYIRFQETERTYTVEEIYRFYLVYGGLPVMKPEYMDVERAWVMADGSYGAIVTRDILELGGGNGSSAVTDPALLRCVISIMARNVGENISATWIAQQTSEYLQRPSATKTIESYIRALLNAHLFYIAERYDIHKGQKLKTLAKFYMVDAGLHNYVVGERAEQETRMMENCVFLEMLRRGYQVYNGKLGKDEIHLVTTDQRGRVYVQVLESLEGERSEGLIATLRRVRDSHPKLIIVQQGESQITQDGIMVLNAMEFLMGADRNR